MSLAATMALSVFPVLLDCSGKVTSPRAAKFEHRRLMFADRAVEFEPRFATLTGVSRASGTFVGKGWTMSGREAGRSIEMTLVVPAQANDTSSFGLDWKTTAHGSAGDLIHSAGVGECRMINPEEKEAVQ